MTPKTNCCIFRWLYYWAKMQKTIALALEIDIEEWKLNQTSRRDNA